MRSLRFLTASTRSFIAALASAAGTRFRAMSGTSWFLGDVLAARDRSEHGLDIVDGVGLVQERAETDRAGHPVEGGRVQAADGHQVGPAGRAPQLAGHLEAVQAG